MPMALPIIAPMIASALGSAILPSIAGSTLLGVGTSTLGGVLGGALAGGLTNENDPLLGAVLGGVGGGLGGPGLAEGAGSLLSGGADLLGLGAEIAPATLENAAKSAAGNLAGAAANTANAAISAAAPSAAASTIAAPAGTAQSLGADSAFSALESDSLAGLDATTSGSNLPVAGDATLNLGAAPQIDAYGLGGGTASAGAAPETANSFLTALDDPSLGNVLNAVDSNKDLLMAGTGLAATAFQDSTLPGEDELASLAAQMKREGELNSGYLNSGQLPTGVEGSLRSSAEAAKAAVRSMFASRGMSGSSSEVQTIANIDQTRAEQGANIAMKLLSQGVQQSQISSRLYDVIMRNALAQDQALGGSIAKFATALAA